MDTAINFALAGLLPIGFFCGLAVGRELEKVRASKAWSKLIKRHGRFTTYPVLKNDIKTLKLNKLLLGQIRGFKKAGGDLLSLTIKSLDSIDKDKLRTIRSFRSLLTWAEKYVAVSK